MTWLRDHPGRAVSEANIAELVGKAYGKAANYDNAVGAFSRTGINPFNPHVLAMKTILLLTYQICHRMRKPSIPILFQFQNQT